MFSSNDEKISFKNTFSTVKHPIIGFGDFEAVQIMGEKNECQICKSLDTCIHRKSLISSNMQKKGGIFVHNSIRITSSINMQLFDSRVEINKIT